MKSELKRILRRGALILTLTAFCISGSYVFAHKQPEAAEQASASASAPVIVLDAGHGGMDGGCSTAEGIPEKGINLNILLDLRDLLELSGYEVHVTRDTDRSIHDKGVEGIANQKSSDMDNRLAILNEPENAVCISIHQNQFPDPQYSGAQMFYSETNDSSALLAQILQAQFQTMLQPENSREIKPCGKELFLCYYCTHPMVMAECGFLSNPEEAAKLTTEEYQRKVAFVIYAGLQQFLASADRI